MDCQQFGVAIIECGDEMNGCEKENSCDNSLHFSVVLIRAI